MSFNQFCELQNLMNRASTPRVNYGNPASFAYGSAQGFYNQAVNGISGERVREIHVADNGRKWDFQYVFAKPLKQN